MCQASRGRRVLMQERGCCSVALHLNGVSHVLSWEPFFPQTILSATWIVRRIITQKEKGVLLSDKGKQCWADNMTYVSRIE